MYARPPGFNSRLISRQRFVIVCRCSTTCMQVIESNDCSGQGSVSDSRFACTNSVLRGALGGRPAISTEKNFRSGRSSDIWQRVSPSEEPRSSNEPFFGVPAKNGSLLDLGSSDGETL